MKLNRIPRGERRNQARDLHTLRDWHKGPHYAITHRTFSNAQGKTVARRQIVHGSFVTA